MELLRGITGMATLSDFTDFWVSLIGLIVVSIKNLVFRGKNAAAAVVVATRIVEMMVMNIRGVAKYIWMTYIFQRF